MALITVLILIIGKLFSISESHENCEELRGLLGESKRKMHIKCRAQCLAQTRLLKFYCLFYFSNNSTLCNTGG